MKSKHKMTGEIVKKMLDDPHFRSRADIWAKIEIVDFESGADIWVFLLDKKGHMLTYLPITTNEDGYVHPGQVIGLIIDAFQIGMERMKYSYRNLDDQPWL